MLKAYQRAPSAKSFLLFRNYLARRSCMVVDQKEGSESVQAQTFYTRSPFFVGLWKIQHESERDGTSVWMFTNVCILP